MVTPEDFGVHQRLNSSGLVHAWYTMRAGALNIRVTTSSRSDVRSTAVLLSFSFFASIKFLLPFQFVDHLVELVKARGPELAVALDPCCLFFQCASAELAGPHTSDLFRGDEARLLQDADVLLH